VNFYKRYMADYSQKTARLTLAQHGAYTLLLDEMYSTERGLPADYENLYRICRAMNKAEQEAVRSVADTFFSIGADGLRHNSRAVAEITQAAPAMEAARLNGQRGGRPKKEPSGFPENNPVGFQNVTQMEPRTKAPHSSEEYLEPNGSVAGSDRMPVCQTQAVIDLYHAALPELPRVKLISEKRKKAISSFWKWVLTSTRMDGVRRATTGEQAVLWIKSYFERARDNDFLMGRGIKAAGHEGWECDLDFLMTEKGMKQVIEKTKEAA